MATWLIELNFGSGFTDYTSSVRQDTLKRRMELHKELRPTTNTLQFALVGSSTMVANLMTGTTDVPIRVTKDGSRWFTGYVQRLPQTSVTSYIGDISCTAYDPSCLLQRKIATTYKRIGGTVAQVVGDLLTAAGCTLQSLGTISNVVDAAVFVEREVTYWDAIAGILSDFGYVLYFDELGTAKTFYLYPSTITSAITFQTGAAGNILNALGLTRKQRRYGGCRVTFNKHQTKTSAIVFSDTSGASGLNKCNINLASFANGYPGRASATDVVYADYAVEGDEIIAASSVTTSIDGSSYSVATFTDYGKRAALRISGTGYLTKLDLVAGTLITKGPTSYKEALISGLSEDSEDYKAEYLQTDALAATLVSGRKAYWERSTVAYTLRTQAAVSIGQIATIVDPLLSISQTALVVSCEEDEWGNIDVVLEGISAYALATITTSGATPSGNSATAEAAQSAALALAALSVDTSDLAAFFNMEGIPEIPDKPGMAYLQDAWATVDGWVATRGALTLPGGRLVNTASGADSYITKTGLSIAGTTHRTIRIKVKIVSGTLPVALNEIQVYYTTSGHGISGSYYKNATELVAKIGEDQVLEFDMTSIAGGGATDDWITNTITGIRLDIGNAAGIVWSIDWIYIGTGQYNFPLLDVSGKGRSGTIYGARPVPGTNKKALRFDGINDYAMIPAASIASLFGVGRIVSVSMKITPRSSGVGYILSFPDSGNGNRFYVQVVDATRCKVVANTGTEIVFPCATGETAVVCAIRDNVAGTLTVYKNGALVGVSSITAPTAASTSLALYLGSSGASYYAAVDIDELVFFSDALTAVEVAGLSRACLIEPAYTPQNYEIDATAVGRYLGAFTADPSSASVLDYYLVSNTNPKKIRRFDGYQWGDVSPTDTRFSSYVAAAINDLVSLDEASGDAANGFAFFTNLVAKNLFAKAIQVLTGGSIRGGSRYNADGSLADGTKPGFLIMANGACKFAGITFEGSQGGGVQWGAPNKEGSPLAITGVTSPGLCAINQDFLALVDGGLDAIREYYWNGSTFAAGARSLAVAGLTSPSVCCVGKFYMDVGVHYALVVADPGLGKIQYYDTPNGGLLSRGSGFTLAGMTAPAVCKLGTSGFALVDSGIGLRAYSISNMYGTTPTIAQVGNTLSLPSIGADPEICAINSTDVAVWGNPSVAGYEMVEIYRFDGSNWSLVGSGFYLQSWQGGKKALSALNGSDLVCIHSNGNTMTTIRWSGSSFSKVGSTGYVGTVGGTPRASAAMSGSEIAYIETNAFSLTKYSFTFALSAPWTIE